MIEADPAMGMYYQMGQCSTAKPVSYVCTVPLFLLQTNSPLHFPAGEVPCDIF